MKADSPTAKALLALLDKTPEGAAIELPPLLPNYDKETKVQAFLVEKAETSWTLACYWHGVAIGDISASLENGNLVLEDV